MQNVIFNMGKLSPDIEFINVGDYIRKNNIPLTIKKEANFKKGIFETHLYSKELNLSFLCDGLLKFKGKYYILEIKTEGSGKFMGHKDVHDEHKIQACCYSTMLQVDSVIFLYENRDFLGKKCYLYTPTKLDKQELLEKLNKGIACVNNKKIPASPENKGRDLCKYCKYVSKCKADGEEEIDYIEKSKE
jgi:hypothetical protein